jgi:hypothetical protein
MGLYRLFLPQNLGQEAIRMRHVIGVVLAIGLAAAVFFAASWGYVRLLRVPVVNGAASTLPAQGGSLLHDSNVLWACAALAGTGLLAGIFVAVRRISPLAAGLPGLALIAWTVVYGFNVSRAVHYIPLRGDAYGAGFEAMLVNGLLAAAGLALIVPLFIPSRWRSRPREAVTSPLPAGYAPPQAPGYYAPGQEQTPSGGSPLLTDPWTARDPWNGETATYPRDEPGQNAPGPRNDPDAY